MKNIILLIFSMILLVGTVSALEIDNKLTYSNEDLKVGFDNLWGFGKYYGSVELKSHSSVNEVKQVGTGNQVVMWYDFDFLELYSNGLGNVEFIDVDTGETIDREFNFVYWGTAQRDVYTETCSKLGNGTSVCDEVTSGTESYETWLPYTSTDIPKGPIRIGIQTNVQIGDKIDGIWTIVGKKISRHAVWSAGLNVGIISYWTGNETSGTIMEDMLRRYNGTANKSDVFTTNVPDIIDTGVDLRLETNGYVVTSTGVGGLNDDIGTGNVTINMWVNITSYVDNGRIIYAGSGLAAADLFTVQTLSPNLVQWGFREGVGGFSVANTSIIANTTQMVTVTRYVSGGEAGGEATAEIYVNGTLDDTLIDAEADVDIGASGANNNWTFGINAFDNLHVDTIVGEIGVWNRTLTQAEITQLYNEGNGITFTTTFLPDISNIFPANNSILETSNINVTANVTSDDTLINVSIFIDGVLNQTNSSGFETNYSFDLALSDALYNVVWEAYSTNGRSQVHNRFSIDTGPPVNMNITSPFGFIPYHVSGDDLKVNWNVSDVNINVCRVLLNDINTTVTCGDNTTTISNVNNVSATEIVFYANDTLGNSDTVNRTFTYSAFQNAVFFNSTSFETKEETFTINITTNSTTPADVELIYNGTTFTGGTATNIAGNNYNLSRTISILTGIGNKSFSFNFTLGGKEINSTSNEQTVSAALFGACNGTLTVPYINFTFKNETLSQENVNATFDTAWVYSLGTLSDSSKSLSFTSATESPNYTFCATPSNLPFAIDVNGTYNNDISQQRSFSLTTGLTNVTTTQVLYLLPTALGIFSPFKTATITGDTLIDVKAVITRVLAGSTVEVTSGFTDGSGFLSVFLDPDETYTATFSKTGFADNSFSFIPTTDLRTVVMGSGPTVIGNGSTIARGLIYNITPTNGTLANNTDVTFTFFVSSNETVTLMSLNITNETNTQFLFDSQASQGLLSGVANTGNQTKLIGTYLINTSNQLITIKKIWIVGDEFEGDYSIYRQLTLFTTYGFSDFIRILMVIFSITAIMIFLTRREVVDTSESKVIVTTLLIWAFSLVGWLDTGLITATDSTGVNRLAQLSSQFGIAILSTGIASFFVLRRVFIRRI